MEPQGFVSRSQESATGTYFEPHEYSLNIHKLFT
jgi:hypothetical protein